jgi:hypothetical protein
MSFPKDLEALINRYSKESPSDTPDFILATYINDCLDAYAKAVKARDKFFNTDVWGRNNKTEVTINDKAI